MTEDVQPKRRYPVQLRPHGAQDSATLRKVAVLAPWGGEGEGDGRLRRALRSGHKDLPAQRALLDLRAWLGEPSHLRSPDAEEVKKIPSPVLKRDGEGSGESRERGRERERERAEKGARLASFKLPMIPTPAAACRRAFSSLRPTSVSL